VTQGHPPREKTRTSARTLNSVATVTKHTRHLMYLRDVDCVCEQTGVSFDASWSGELYKILPLFEPHQRSYFVA
jgi:hypothetical protein